MSLNSRRLSFVSALVVSLYLPMLAAEASAGQTDFSGTWKLNQEKSDPIPSRGGRGRGGRGGGGRGRRGGRGGLRPVRLVITQNDGSLNVVEEGAGGNQRERILEPGGGPRKISTQRGTAIVDVKWNGKKLAVRQVQEIDTPRGTLTIEQEQTWELTEGGKALKQKISRNTPRGKMTYTLVYDKQ